MIGFNPRDLRTRGPIRYFEFHFIRRLSQVVFLSTPKMSLCEKAKLKIKSASKRRCQRKDLLLLLKTFALCQ